MMKTKLVYALSLTIALTFLVGCSGGSGKSHDFVMEDNAAANRTYDKVPVAKMKNKKFEEQIVKTFQRGDDLYTFRKCIITSDAFQYEKEYGKVVARTMWVALLCTVNKDNSCKYFEFVVAQPMIGDKFQGEFRRQASLSAGYLKCEDMKKAL